MDKELDKLGDAAIEEAFIQQREQYNYEDEITNLDEECCEECVGQTTYYLKG